ncbi:hypothetical protein GZH49_11945 [Nocardia terpenica]
MITCSAADTICLRPWGGRRDHGLGASRYDVFVRESRAFVRRAVLMLAAGIDQFLDLGAGLGGVRHVHELA